MGSIRLAAVAPAAASMAAMNSGSGTGWWLPMLRTRYGAAEVAVVGGTIGPYGGHNPLEPAAAGAAVVIGPHHTSQRDAVEALRARGAVVIADGEAALGEALTALLGDPGRREVVARDGLAVVRARRGAVLRTVREVRNALRYVLNNARRHLQKAGRAPSRACVDPCSSGAWFQGWRPGVRLPEAIGPPPVARATKWLARVGWRRLGLLDPA